MFGSRRERGALSVARLVVFLLIVSVLIYMTVRICEYFNTQYQMMLHPLTYSEYVDKYASEFGVDRDLIYSVIKVESNFKPDAVSNVGARGLMQIMEDTFDWIKYRLRDDNSEYDDMFDAKTNIRYGAYLISYNLEYFGDTTSAIAAYHAGTGGVEKWLGDQRYSSDGRTLTDIPSTDTEHYVDKVKKANAKYVELYPELNKKQQIRKDN